ncbi:MAG: hypothetical protein PHV62_09520, partial [Sulfuricurvum sp.]|nr:hypothetical protein [Sulfuricurvum sp.]
EKTANGIQVAVNTMSNDMNKTLDTMKTGFVDSMKQSSDAMLIAMENSSNKLHDMNIKFSSSMEVGSNQLKTAMEKSSTELQAATTKIKTAVEQMSTDVSQTQGKLQETMQKVGDSIKESGDNQNRILLIIKNSSAQVSELSNKSQAAINDSLNKLGDQLSTISTCNIEMRNAVRNLNGSIVEFNGQLGEYLSATETMHEG